MDQIALRIQLFHRLYLTCMAGMLFFFVVSVVLFWKHDMRTVFAYFAMQQVKRESRSIKKRNYDEDTAVLSNIPARFRVEREILFVHTEEVID